MEVSGQLHPLLALPLGQELPAIIGEDAGWAPDSVWSRWQREKNPITAPVGN
jgi:hypothetical protein